MMARGSMGVSELSDEYALCIGRCASGLKVALIHWVKAGSDRWLMVEPYCISPYVGGARLYAWDTRAERILAIPLREIERVVETGGRFKPRYAVEAETFIFDQPDEEAMIAGEQRLVENGTWQIEYLDDTLTWRVYGHYPRTDEGLAHYDEQIDFLLRFHRHWRAARVTETHVIRTVEQENPRKEFDGDEPLPRIIPTGYPY